MSDLCSNVCEQGHGSYEGMECLHIHTNTSCACLWTQVWSSESLSGPACTCVCPASQERSQGWSSDRSVPGQRTGEKS